MSRFASDSQKNKDLVTATLRSQENFFELIEKANKVAEEALEYSSTSVGRRNVAQFVNENVYDFAVWKATSSVVAWVSFQSTLKNNRVTERDQINIRQVINAQFEELLADATYDLLKEETKYIEIEVKNILGITKGGRGIKIRYEELS